MYVARDGDNGLTLFEEKPFLEPELAGNIWLTEGSYITLDCSLLPEITFENSPKEVIIQVK
jgi:hypothetical protein